MRPPAWVRELLRAHSFGRDVVAYPMYPFRRWTWTIPPSDWKQRLFLWSFVGFGFGLMALGNPTRIKTQPGFVAAFGLMAMLFLTLVVRLAWHVWKQREHLEASAHNKAEQTRQWTSWEEAVGGVVGTVVAAAWLWSMPRNERFTLSTGSVLVWTWLAACAFMAVWALIERWRQTDGDGVSSDNTSSANSNIVTKPVARRFHLTLIAGLVLMVMLFLSSAIVRLIIPERPAAREPVVHRYTKDGLRVRVKVPEAFKPVASPKGRPPQLVVAASMGLIFGLFLLRRVIKLRDQLPRPIRLPLLSISVLAVALGAGLTAHGVWKAEARSREPAAALTPATPEHREPVFKPSPSQLEVIQKYANEAAVITVPDEQLPEGWYIHRYDNGFESPMPDEGLHRDLARSLGLPDVPELQAVVATLSRTYENPFVPGGIDSVCVVYAFCCRTAADASKLNEAWQNRGLRIDRLMIMVYGRQGLRGPSLTDQAPVPTLFNHIQHTALKSNTHD